MSRNTGLKLVLAVLGVALGGGIGAMVGLLQWPAGDFGYMPLQNAIAIGVFAGGLLGMAAGMLF